jgi:hypothetical protein
VTLGKGLLDLCQRITALSELPEEGPIIGARTAPLIIPGPHPLRPSKES